MLGLKLNHVSKRGHRCQNLWNLYLNEKLLALSHFTCVVQCFATICVVMLAIWRSMQIYFPGYANRDIFVSYPASVHGKIKPLLMSCISMGSLPFNTAPWWVSIERTWTLHVPRDFVRFARMRPSAQWMHNRINWKTDSLAHKRTVSVLSADDRAPLSDLYL